MVQYVDVEVVQVLYRVGMLHIAMKTDKDGMGYICPKCGVLHGDVSASAGVTLAGGVNGSAIVGVAAEYTIEEYIVAGEDIHPVSPAVRTDGLYVAYGHAVRTTGGALSGDEPFYRYVPGIADVNSFATFPGMNDAATQYLCIADIESTDAALSLIHI